MGPMGPMGPMVAFFRFPRGGQDTFVASFHWCPMIVMTRHTRLITQVLGHELPWTEIVGCRKWRGSSHGKRPVYLDEEMDKEWHGWIWNQCESYGFARPDIFVADPSYDAARGLGWGWWWPAQVRLWSLDIPHVLLLGIVRLPKGWKLNQGLRKDRWNQEHTPYLGLAARCSDGVWIREPLTALAVLDGHKPHRCSGTKKSIERSVPELRMSFTRACSFASGFGQIQSLVISSDL